MKLSKSLRNKLKPPTSIVKHSREDDDRSSVMKRPSWMMTSPEEKKKAVQESRVLSGGRRAPELWFKDGDEKIIRIRDEGDLGAIWRYQVEVDGRWQAYTKPGDDDTDLFREELGLKPALRYIYEVIDVSGYVDKKSGKKVKNVARFWVVPAKVHEQLEKIRQKRGPLNRFDIEVTCTGERISKGYGFFPEADSSMTGEQKAVPRLSKELDKYFGPVPENEQRMIVKRAYVRSRDDAD